MPCYAIITPRLYDIAAFRDIALSLGFQIVDQGSSVLVEGFGVKRLYRKDQLAALSQEEARSLLGKAVQSYTVKKSTEAARKQGFRVTQKQRQDGVIELLVEV